ncbi:hypothetical protein Droror1_Dr00026522 [Drosera rotundifolia]
MKSKLKPQKRKNVLPLSTAARGGGGWAAALDKRRRVEEEEDKRREGWAVTQLNGIRFETWSMRGYDLVNGMISAIDFISSNGSQEVNKIFSKNAFDVLMHFAAVAYVGESTLEPLRYYHSITSNTLGVLEAMAAHGVKTLIYSSTCATYGEPEKMPIIEETPQVLFCPPQAAIMCSNRRQLPCSLLRCALVQGTLTASIWVFVSQQNQRSELLWFYIHVATHMLPASHHLC